jgi:DNA-binding CsgD family transcriptional regulator
LTNAQIGEQLSMSRSTVKAHLSRAYTKLGIGTRAELAAAVARRPESPSAGSDATYP